MKNPFLYNFAQVDHAKSNKTRDERFRVQHSQVFCTVVKYSILNCRTVVNFTVYSHNAARGLVGKGSELGYCIVQNYGRLPKTQNGIHFTVCSVYTVVQTLQCRWLAWQKFGAIVATRC